MPVDPSNLEVALTGMANSAAAANERRVGRFDQLSADSAAMWSVHLTSPTVLAGMGLRVSQQPRGYPDPTYPNPKPE
jgi:hypothetical protein